MINDNLLRHTGVVRVLNYLSLVLIIRKLRCIAFFYMKRNSQVQIWIMPYALRRRTVQCCMHCFIVSSKAAALPIAPWGIIYINSPSGTDDIFCILVKLCWLEQFPLLALVPCPSPPVGTSRKIKGIFFILLHSWQDKEGSAPHFLFVIRKTCITSLVVKSKVILLKFERKNSSGFFDVFIIIIFF